MSNTVYEITQMLGDKEKIRNDMTEACVAVQNLFKEKYVNRFHDAVLTHQKQVKKNTPKEIGLLNALKPFVNPKQHEHIDKCIDWVIMLNTAKSINSELAAAYQQSIMQASKPIRAMSNDSVHDDGIYDIDNSCMLQKGTNFPKDSPYNLTSMFLLLTLITEKFK